MPNWKAIVGGGAAGFLVGGPFGAAAGAAIGAFVGSDGVDNVDSIGANNNVSSRTITAATLLDHAKPANVTPQDPIAYMSDAVPLETITGPLESPPAPRGGDGESVGYITDVSTGGVGNGPGGAPRVLGADGDAPPQPYESLWRTVQ